MVEGEDRPFDDTRECGDVNTLDEDLDEELDENLFAVPDDPKHFCVLESFSWLCLLMIF